MTSLFTADELSHATGGLMTRPFHATGVSIDTRSLHPGDLFVALKTDHGDGQAHVAEALHKGACGVVVHSSDAMPDEAPLLVVRDTLEALRELAAFARTRFQGAVFAITGSVGKTTTKEMLRTILSASGQTHAAHASYNNHWGVPLSLVRMPEAFDFAVLELGMNHAGEIAPLARLAAPDVAVITTVAAAHIGHLGSLEAIADEKAALLEEILPGGTAVLPAESAWLGRMTSRVPEQAKVKLFGADNLLSLREDADGSDLRARIEGVEIGFRLGAPGRHMVMNALAALTAAGAMGVDIARGAEALAGFSPAAGRGVRRTILNGKAALLDESYNASAASVRAALAVLKLQPASRLVAVLGDMLELGVHSRDEHESLAGVVGESADVLYACGPWMKFLFDALPASQRGAHAPDSTALAPIVAAGLRAGDAVLVKGSLGSRMRVIVDALEAAAG